MPRLLPILHIWSSPARAQALVGPPLDQAPGDLFGYSLASDGDRLLIAAPFSDDQGLSTGSAYVFRYDDPAWSQEGKLLAVDGATNRQFSRDAVSLSGDRALVGLLRSGGPADAEGYAYVFARVDGAWQQTARLEASDRQSNDQFGIAVGLDGTRALIGAHRADTPAWGTTGAAYVFDRVDGVWTESAKLAAQDAYVLDRFGAAVALEGSRAVIGAPEKKDPAGRTGAVYVFEHDGDTWTQTAKLTHPLLTAGDRFGTAVALRGDRILVGAPFHDAAGPDAGAAFGFTLQAGEWTLDAAITPSDAAPTGLFGRSVALAGNRALVGVGFDDWFGNGTGAAYLFERADGDWREIARFQSDPSEADDWFGYSVALSESHAFVGAPFADLHAEDAGATYAFPPAATSRDDAPQRPGLTLRVGPTPFADLTTVQVRLTAPAPLRVRAFDARGREVATLAEGLVGSGVHRLPLRPGPLPAGPYLIRAETETARAHAWVLYVR